MSNSLINRWRQLNCGRCRAKRSWSARSYAGLSRSTNRCETSELIAVADHERVRRLDPHLDRAPGRAAVVPAGHLRGRRYRPGHGQDQPQPSSDRPRVRIITKACSRGCCKNRVNQQTICRHRPRHQAECDHLRVPNSPSTTMTCGVAIPTFISDVAVCSAG